MGPHSFFFFLTAYVDYRGAARRQNAGVPVFSNLDVPAYPWSSLCRRSREPRRMDGWINGWMRVCYQVRWCFPANGGIRSIYVFVVQN